MKVLQVINGITETSGTNAKLDYIAGLGPIEFDMLSEVVEATYMQGLSYYMTEIPAIQTGPNSLFDNVGSVERTTLGYAIQKLKQISLRGSANQSVKQEMALIKAGLPKDDQDVLDKIVSRDLRCGVQLKGFRKVFGADFCPDFPKMLCEAYNAKKIAKNITFPAISELKSDGSRCQYVPAEHATQDHGRYAEGLYSRSGSLYKGLDHIERELVAIYGDNKVLDGELIVVDTDEYGQPYDVDRKIANGILNKAIKGTLSPLEAKKVRFRLWDCIDVYEWANPNKEDIIEKYFVRNALLQAKYNQYLDCDGDIDYIELTPSKLVANLREAQEHYSEMVALGNEGTILKDKQGLWCDKRTATQFKFKEEFDAEVEVTGWYPGKVGTKYEGLIGGYIVKSSCGNLETRIGGGLSDKDRMENGDKNIGLIMQVRYNARSQRDGSDIWALSHGRFIEWRGDKTEADSVEKMEAQEEAVRSLNAK